MTPRLLLLGALALAACAARIGAEDGPGDGGSGAADGGPIGAADARPPDAGAAVLPCVEGDDQVQAPAGGACYLYFAAPRSWSDAQAACAALGGHLATITSLAENELLSRIAPATDGLQDIWVGGSDGVAEGAWAWIDGEPFGFSHWRDGEPNDGAGGEDCMIVEGDNNVELEGCLWDDRACADAYPYLCER